MLCRPDGQRIQRGAAWLGKPEKEKKHMWCAVLELGEEEEVHDVPDAGEEGEEKEDMTTQEEEMKR